ncbi:hypothetical protein QJV32_06465 [Listeria cossartiae subsp. cayugensis]|uniref:Uncharacterized protein n=2 Tax=Listeria TaxID=1637 RepID=A0ABU2IM66_9LIST|nr:hypothetical protein [Listeria cossartiae]MDT0049276.1 hypothetical protein [Listeria cossartiae subsp. cayugensis]MDT0065779.1 hypothetical protein [Listeria cossartiae subsp. cayugensis]MDT0081453.1 hypothetical protein [Listeria cossartiae subsp. cayugensis]MDT0088012.1 hypothetical protein [Listeria cossartiae subsp. cayugensis]MDT0113771.1 hypothetical protein [Listeria cossartiae subsp. cayugensis]
MEAKVEEIDYMPILTSVEVEKRIKKLINVEKCLPQQVFLSPEKYNFYFEEPEAIYMDTKEFIHMIKQIVEITQDEKAYISEIVGEKKFLQKSITTLNLRETLDFTQSEANIVENLDFENITEITIFLYCYMYFPSEQLFLFVNEYLDTALLAVDKKLEIDIPWYDVKTFLTVENLGMKDRLYRKFRKRLVKSYSKRV